MRRRLATLAAMSMFALALTASPVAASPMIKVTLPAKDTLEPAFMCGYSVTSGEVTVVSRDPSTAAHVTLNNVVATRDGASYKVVGVETYNDLKGHLTIKVMFIGKGGGIADSINVVFRAGRNFAAPGGDPGPVVALGVAIDRFLFLGLEIDVQDGHGHLAAAECERGAGVAIDHEARALVHEDLLDPAAHAPHP